ncbi:MAG: hypothetical protein HYW86_02470 [Candidatus Roizmanbacteria bacterium]|nr:MAG: hypothetical protein HYW86_02470 [Candidatus Roizmanbacteria bacterium]
MIENTHAIQMIGLKKDPNPPLDHQFSFSDLPTIDDVLLSAKGDERFQDIYNNPKNLHPTEEEMKLIIDSARKEIYALECAARNPEIWNIDENTAKSIVLIVDFSAPGKYRYPRKPDQYEKFLYSWGMDRFRADAVAQAGILIAGKRTGHDLSAFGKVKLLSEKNIELANLRPEARKSIEESGLRFLYLGTPEEGESVRKVLVHPSSFVPAENVDIINNPKITNTLDQVMAMKDYLSQNTTAIKPGDSILFVCHSPQLMRTLRLIEKQKATPPGINLIVLPLPIPTLGMKLYPEMEIKGMLGHYMTGVGSTAPFPYKIIGQ